MKRNLWKLAPIGFVGAISMMGCGGGGDDDPVDAATVADAAVTVDGSALDGTVGVDGTATVDGAVTACTDVDVTAEVTADTTWTSDKCYRLKTHIFVRSPATLTIQPGTLVKGDTGSSLVVTQGAKIAANGELARPIVFTSSKAVGMRRPGDWGGIVLLGRAPINVQGGTTAIEGFPPSETRTTYGGADPNDNSGTLRYVRIEFAGFELSPAKELNGLSLGGVGRGTTIDYVQVHLGSDDGIEAFGGTVDLKHIAITQADDDGLDWDFGWVGRVQFLVIQQNATGGDSGYEADNHPTDFSRTPTAMPTISNATVVSSRSTTKTQVGLVLRRGTGAKLHNHIITGFSGPAIDVRDAASAALANANPSTLYAKNSIFFANAPNMDNFPAEAQSGTPPVDNDANMLTESTYFTSVASGNRSVDPQLTAATSLTSPNFAPAAGSPALTGSAPPTDSFFDASATFVGAVGTTNWLSGWTAYPAN